MPPALITLALITLALIMLLIVLDLPSLPLLSLLLPPVCDLEIGSRSFILKLNLALMGNHKGVQY